MSFTYLLCLHIAATAPILLLLYIFCFLLLLFYVLLIHIFLALALLNFLLFAYFIVYLSIFWVLELYHEVLNLFTWSIKLPLKFTRIHVSSNGNRVIVWRTTLRIPLFSLRNCFGWCYLFASRIQRWVQVSPSSIDSVMNHWIYWMLLWFGFWFLHSFLHSLLIDLNDHFLTLSCSFRLLDGFRIVRNLWLFGWFAFFTGGLRWLAIFTRCFDSYITFLLVLLLFTWRMMSSRWIPY